MIFNLTGGSSGASLNFKVVGGTSAPSSPTENTIWINTDTEILDWVFSAAQPTAATGRVWIQTGASSPVEFNALKKNGIQVYPISAKQYVRGAWVDKAAKSYQGGSWVEFFDGFICKNGQLASNYSYIINGSSFTQKEDSIELNHSGSFVIDPKVDVTNYSKLIFKISASTNDATVGLATTSGDTAFVASASISTYITAHTVTVDISSLTGEYWIKVAGFNDVVGITINIYDIKME